MVFIGFGHPAAARAGADRAGSTNAEPRRVQGLLFLGADRSFNSSGLAT